MRIDYVVAIDLALASGKSKATSEKARYMRSCGADVSVFAIRRAKWTPLSIFRMWLLEVRYFIHVLNPENRPDLIIARSYFFFGSYLAALLFRVPVLHEVHGDFMDEQLLLYRKKKVRLAAARVLHAYQLFFIRRADGLIFNHPYLQAHYQARYGVGQVPSIAVYNGADTSYFAPEPERVARSSIGVDPDREYIVFVGSVSRWHGVESVLAAFRQIMKYNDRVDLLIVGGANAAYLAELKKRYSDTNRIVFTGAVDRAHARSYINAATVCVLPVNDSRASPGSPLKLFDYIACGKPVVTQRNVVGYSDLVERFNLGICVDFADAAQSGELIARFLHGLDPDFYLRNNRAIAETELSWERVVLYWLDFAQRVANSS